MGPGLRAAVAAVAFAAAALPSCQQFPPQQPHPSGQFSKDLDGRVTFVVHNVGQGPCLADVFGIKPPDATDISQVTDAYAWMICPVGNWVSTPLAVDLTTTPATIRIPRDGPDYRSDIDRIFPPDVRQAALGQKPHNVGP